MIDIPNTTNLIEFSVTNYRSIKQKMTLSMVSGKSKRNTFTNKASKASLMRSVVIFGANASGKSNLIRSMHYFVNLITGNAEPFQKIGRESDPTPFMLDSGSRVLPTTFSITVSYNGKIFTYTIGLDHVQQSISSERLRVKYPKTPSGITIYKRNYNTVTINAPRTTDSLMRHGITATHRRLLQADRLFITTLASLAKPTIASEFVEAIEGIHIFNTYAHKPIDMLIDVFEQNSDIPDQSTMKQAVLTFLLAADLSIANIEVRNQGDSKEVYVIHQYKDGSKLNSQAFSIYEESYGTRKMLENVVPIIYSLVDGSPYIVDELDHTLHPLLLRFIIKLFHKSQTNAQLVMTSHDVTLMDDRDDLTKDQVFFIERLSDYSSDLYSLADFDIRNTTRNLSKRYLDGEFGARPSLKEDYRV